MKASLILALVGSIQAKAVSTSGDCSDLYATCPTTDCCGTGRKDLTKSPNTALTGTDVLICRPVADNKNQITIDGTTSHYVFTCNNFQDLGAKYIGASVATAVTAAYLLAQ